MNRLLGEDGGDEGGIVDGSCKLEWIENPLLYRRESEQRGLDRSLRERQPGKAGNFFVRSSECEL